MKQIAIILISFSLCFGAGKMPKKMEQLKQDLQEKYQVFSMDDLYKLKTPSQSSNRSASRDMEDLVGDWIMEDESLELFVTVGSDQSIPDPFSTMGFVEAVGGVTATTSDFETDLNYLMIGLFGDDGPDCNMNCEGEYDNYMSYGYDVSDEYCECCHEDYPIDEICEDDGGDNLSLEFEGIADMYYARYGAAYATDGNMVYAICGADWDSEVDSTVYHTHGERYNPGDDSWEMFGENLLQRRYTSAEYVNGSIYVFNGYNGNSASDTVEIINTTTGEVTYSATNPYPVWYGGSAVWNDKIYIFGGSNIDNSVYGYSNRIYEFDPTDESWTRLADMPDGKQTNGQVVNGILYTLGGYNGSASSSHINAYDIEQNTWETVGDMSVGISAHSVATDGELIFVIGDYSDIEFCGVYDPNEDEFFELETNMEGRRHSSSVYMDGDVYTFGGSQPEGFNSNEDHYVVLSSAERAEIIDDERNYDALTFAQNYVNDNSSDWGESVFDLESEFSLVIDGDYVSGGLGGDDPGNCEINWPEDPYKMAVYSFVSEYVLYEGGSVGCFTEDFSLDQTYADAALEMEQQWMGDDDDDGDDWSPELVITNLNLIEFFMIMMGEDPDSLGVENPMVVGVSSTQTESGDIVFDEVFAMLFNEDGDGVMADSAEAVAATSVDTVENTITFTSLSLYDSTETAVLTLSGTIGPGMLDFVAGEETAFPFLEGLEGLFDEGDYDAFMLFNEDSTGMEIEVVYDFEDEYYSGTYADTSYFTWSATSDSLSLYEDSEDYYDQVDTTEMAYFIDGDTLSIEASFDPCEDEDSFEDCMEFATQEIAGLDELEDIQSLRLSMQRVLTPGSYTAVDPENGSLPSEFKLYAAYPNPFNPVATIRFDVGEASHESTLRIFDISGRNVATLISGHLESGTYEVKWDARGFASGVYFSELISGQNRHTQKMVLLK